MTLEAIEAAEHQLEMCLKDGALDFELHQLAGDLAKTEPREKIRSEMLTFSDWLHERIKEKIEKIANEIYLE